MNVQESTTILNAGTQKSGNLLNVPRIYIFKKRGRKRDITLVDLKS